MCFIVTEYFIRGGIMWDKILSGDYEDKKPAAAPTVAPVTVTEPVPALPAAIPPIVASVVEEPPA